MFLLYLLLARSGKGPSQGGGGIPHQDVSYYLIIYVFFYIVFFIIDIRPLCYIIGKSLSSS